MSVIIVDYGMGNLFSVKRMLDDLLVKNFISSKPEDILQAERIILPGVGSFKSAMENLQKSNLIDALHQAVKENKTPFLGICLGMQLMAKASHEGYANLTSRGLSAGSSGETKGLGWLDATVERLDVKDHRIPHMGWNNVKMVKPTPLFKSFINAPTFYFTHSYVMKHNQENEVIATCDYGTTFPVAIQAENLFGTQFHPEKSQLNGKILIENFLSWRA